MSYNARLRATQKRVSGQCPANISQLTDPPSCKKNPGWEVGSSQASSIGIPARLVRKISERTSTVTIENGKIIKDDRDLVVCQNTLSGVGRNHSQFNTDTASQSRGGIKICRYYLKHN